jgi:hypothetical protein
MSSATAAWRSIDAACIAAVGLVLVTKDALDRADAVVEAARAVLTPEPAADYLSDLRAALAAHDATERTGGSDR